MKKYFLLGIVLLALLIAAKSVEQKPAELVKVDYLVQLDSLVLSIEDLESSLSNKDEASIIRSYYLKSRSRLKKTEIFLAYFDKEYTKKFINGAPLLTLRDDVPSDHIKKPEGFQVIDELLYEDSIDYPLVLEHVSKLKRRVRHIRELHQEIQFVDRHVFEALKEESIRIGSLGITGFDTPGSLEALLDAESSLTCSKGILVRYQGYYPNDEMALNSAMSLIERGIESVKNSQFETFDRFTFFQKVLLPYQKCLSLYHTASGVEKNYETSFTEFAVNQDAAHMFDPSFLNRGFYTDLNDRDDNTRETSLGQLLFFDPILSGNNKRACASCHQPEKAFTDGEVKSHAFDFEGTLARNSPTLVNSVYSNRFFWDLRAEKLKNQMEHVVTSHQEFNTNFHDIVSKLNASSEYRVLFKETFKTAQQPISKNTINRAISAYIQSLTALNSPFDKAVRDERNVSTEVKEGFNLFMGKAACGTCHFAPTFSGLVPPYFEEIESEVLGVPQSLRDSATLDSDLGRYGGGRPQEAVSFHRHSFKTVTVRNIALTEPYMHNGVFSSIDEVLAFYNKGGGIGNGILLDHQTLAGDPLLLNKEELDAIKGFLESLTDTSGLNSRPSSLPQFENNASWNTRVIGGQY